MPVSASIYDAIGRGVQPVEDPQNALLKALKLQGAQQELQTGSMKMDEYRRGVERNNKLQQLLSGDYADDDARAGALVKGGYLKEADDYLKGRADVTQKRALAKKTENELVGEGLKRYREQLDYIESPQTAARWLQAQYQDPTIGPVMAKFGPVEEALSRIPQDPQAFAQWREQQTQGMEKYRASIEQKPTSVDAGGTKKFLDMNPKSPTYKQEISSTTVTETEAQRLMRERQAADAKAGREVTIRGQDKVDARARDANLQASKAPAGYRYKPDGTMEAIPGGPADLKNTAGTAAKVTDAQDVLSLLDQAEPLLDKSTNSYTGAAIDEVGRAFGGATGGARAAAQLRALEGALIAKMPKMSGPQSDKDVLLYKQMAGQIGDRTIPAEQKRAAMQTIREINNRHAGTVPKPAGALSPEDAQAREWAAKNPNDPRAKQIMQRLGGG